MAGFRRNGWPDSTGISGRIPPEYALKAEPGKDIWLFGGGDLFRTLLDAGVVDDIEVAYVPVLVGGGIPLRALPATQHRLTLSEHRVYEKSGTVMVTYAAPTASET